MAHKKMTVIWITMLLLAVVSSSSSESLMGGHLDNNDRPQSRTADLDLDLTPEESAPSLSALISDGIQYRMPGLYAFNGGLPFSLEKDPITGKIDFDKAPLKVLNYTTDKLNDTDYEYDDNPSVLPPNDDIFKKENIDRKDSSVDGARPNDINPYSPSFYDFLNLPAHYSSGKYSKDKYPMISSSYANTKVQSGVNSYSTYNHRPYTETTTKAPLYYTTHETYLPRTTMRLTTTPRPTSRKVTTTTTTTTERPTTRTTTTTRKPPTTTKHAPPAISTWKPSTTLSTTMATSTTMQSNTDGAFDSDEVMPLKPMPGKKPLYSSIPVSHNSHSRPILSDEYEDAYEYDDVEEKIEEQNYKDTMTSPSSTAVPPMPSSTVTPTTAKATTTTTEKPQQIHSNVDNDGSIPIAISNNFTAKPPQESMFIYSQPAPPSAPVATSLPLGVNYPQRPSTDLTVPNNNGPTQFGSFKPTTIRPALSTNDLLKLLERPIPNNLRPVAPNRPMESVDNNVRPLNLNPNGMRPVESTSNVVVPPGQNTVTFVLGNQQNVDGGQFVGSAMQENPYVPNNEGAFRPIFTPLNGEPRPSQVHFIPQQGINSPLALASIGANSKPMLGSGTSQKRPNYPNDIDSTQTFGYNAQNRPFPPKINGVEPPRPSPLPSFVNPPPPYLDAPPLPEPSTMLNVGSNPLRVNVMNPQSGPSGGSLNLGVRSSLNTPPIPIASRPLSSNVINPAESPLNFGSVPFFEPSSNTGIPPQGNQNAENRIHHEVDNKQEFDTSSDSVPHSPQSDFVVFPGKNQDRPVEEHVIIVNEADGTVQELPPTTKGNVAPAKPDEPVQDGLPQLSESLTPPERPLERPAGPYPARPYDGRPRPLYPPRPDFLKPPRLPPHSKPSGPEGAYKRPLSDSNLPNILPQFRPNAKASYGHHGHDLIGTVPAQYGPNRQPLIGRRPLPTHLQRLSPPPPPGHGLRHVPEGEERFREPAGKDGHSFQDNPENQRFQNQESANQRFPGPSSETTERFQDTGVKRFRVPPAQNERFQSGPSETQRFQGPPTAEGGRFSGQKLRHDEPVQSTDVAGFERFSAEPPQVPPRPLVNRRSGDYEDVPQVATLQMIQQQSGLDERLVKPNLPPPFRVNYDKDDDAPDADEDDDNDDEDKQKDDGRPVYVVYPVNTAVNFKDDSADDVDDSVVIGTRGPHRPLPPDNLPLNDDENDNDALTDIPILPPRRDTPLLKPQNRPFLGPPMKSDFPYPLERPDPSLLMPQEKPLLVPNGKIDEENEDKDDDPNQHDDSSINIIPYLQDYMPFATRKPEHDSPVLKPNRPENTWPPSDTESRIVSRPEASLYKTPISVTLRNVAPTTVTPIAYAYTPTTDTLVVPSLGIRPSNRVDIPTHETGQEESNQKPVLPSQQPSSSSSSAPSPQNFMAPFMASMSAEAPATNGWSVVAKPEPEDKSDKAPNDTETQTENSEFDIENFKPQLFGGFKPIYEFPEDEELTPKVTDIPDRGEMI